MTIIRCRHTFGDVADDLKTITRRAPKDMIKVVRAGIRDGERTARAFAKESAGAHGKHYPRAITSEMHNGFGLFGNVYSGEWGPDVNKPQGDMSFEGGSRNQPPHNDLAKSQDRVTPTFHAEAARLPAQWFWPGGS